MFKNPSIAHVNRLNKARKNPEAHVGITCGNGIGKEQEAEEVASRMVLATPNLNEGQTGTC